MISITKEFITAPMTGWVIKEQDPDYGSWPLRHAKKRACWPENASIFYYWFLGWEYT